MPVVLPKEDVFPSEHLVKGGDLRSWAIGESLEELVERCLTVLESLDKRALDGLPTGADVADSPGAEMAILEKPAEPLQAASAEKSQAFAGEEKGPPGEGCDFVVEATEQPATFLEKHLG